MPSALPGVAMLRWHHSALELIPRCGRPISVGLPAAAELAKLLWSPPFPENGTKCIKMTGPPLHDLMLYGKLSRRKHRRPALRGSKDIQARAIAGGLRFLPCLAGSPRGFSPLFSGANPGLPLVDPGRASHILL